MAKIIKLIIAIIVVLLLCVGGFVYYNSNKPMSTQANSDLNNTSTNVDKSKSSTNDNKNKKENDNKKAIETKAQENSKTLTNNDVANNNASNKVQEAPANTSQVSTNNNSNSNNSNYSVTTTNASNNSSNNNGNNNTNSNNNNKAELSSLKTQCESAFSSIENQVNQINNEPSTNSYQATEQQNHIYNLWNNQLNYMYEKLETILPHSTFETLNNSEVNWINYKTNESSKYSDVDEEGAGAMRYYYKDAQLTKERCYYLYNNYIK